MSNEALLPAWTRVDEYFSQRLLPPDPVLEAALISASDAGLPAIAVSPNQGRLLEIIARTCRAKSILEIGTLAGYSTICLARGLAPGGRVVSIEIDPHHAEVARANIAHAGLSNTVEIIQGSALDVLPRLADDQPSSFDIVFIDADKANIPAYFQWAVKLSHAGSLIIVDNVVRDGAVVNENSDDPSVNGVRKFIDDLSGKSGFISTTIQTVGMKGYDGFTVVLRT